MNLMYTTPRIDVHQRTEKFKLLKGIRGYIFRNLGQIRAQRMYVFFASSIIPP